MSGIVIYGCYKNEFALKNEILRSFEQNKMNEDLTDLLMNLPKPVILIRESDNEVVMGNKELCKLLSTDEKDGRDAIATRIAEKIFQPYNYIEGLGDSEIQ